MKYEARDLFRIENNINFRWQEISRLPTKYRQSLEWVIHAFGIRPSGSFERMIKRNRESTLLRFHSPEGARYVLRSGPSHLAQGMERQCQVAASLDCKNLLKALPHPKNRYGILHSDLHWTLYPYIPGETFNGRNADLEDVLCEGLDFLALLKQSKMITGLKKSSHQKSLWTSTFRELLIRKKFQSKEFQPLFSPRMREMLSKNEREILGIVAEVSRWKPSLIGVTHKDLNHSNILIHNGHAFMTDLEAIGIESLPLAIGHMVFKLLRHSIYAAHLTSAQAQHTVLPQILKRLQAGPFGFHDKRSFFLIAAYRIISDIQLVANAVKSGKNLKNKNAIDPRDLEKKFMNLFELFELTFGT